jgi:glucose/mannose transport system substrate-binding protein
MVAGRAVATRTREEGMNKLLLAGVAALSVLAGSALAQETTEVIHHFTSATERDSLKILADKFDAQGGKWVDNAVAGPPNSRRLYTSRMQAGQPPQAYATVTNRDHLDFIKQGFLIDIDAVATEGKWREQFPKAIVDAISGEDGKIYLVPTALYIPNMAFYNKAVFDKLGIEVPTTFDDKFFAALDKLKANNIIPLAFSADPFHIRFPFEGMVLALGGTEMWQKVWVDRDEATLRSDEFRKIIETFGRLRDYVDEGATGRAWNLSANMLASGQAGIQIMGSWASGEYRAAGLKAGEGFGCFVPGGMTHVHGDVFVFPKQPGATAPTAGQTLLAQIASDPANQTAYVEPRGAIPARLDAAFPSNGDACLQLGLDTFRKEGALVGNPRSFIDPQVDGEYRDIVNEYFADKDMSVDEVIDRLVEALKAS